MVYEPFILSAKILAICLVLFLVFGTMIASFLAHTKSKFKFLVESLVTLPLIFPPVAIGFFLLMGLGKRGFIGSFFAEFDIYFIFEFNSLVIAGFIAGLPLYVKPVQASLELFPKNIKEASLLSGKSKLETLVFIILPCIKKSILSALIIALGRALGEVGISLILGGNIIGKTDTLSLAIYNAVYDGEYELAMRLSVILVIISLILFIILHFLNKKEKI
ncbi:MAG: ABC transporter permease subunit [Campylobacteraceae bacterium]|nr:ABC transporter permease subunit [Campylobacteraceae bacterium]